VRGGGDDTVRVDNESESQTSRRVGIGDSLVRVLAVLLLAGAVVLVAVGGYLVAITCWEVSFVSPGGPRYPGCRDGGLVDAVGLILLAQIPGVVGFAMLRQLSWGLQGRQGAHAEVDGDSNGLEVRYVRFWLGTVLSVLLVVAGVLSLAVGLFSLAFACWTLSDSGCDVRSATIGVAFVLLGEALGAVGWISTRRVFRRRPWRRDAQRE